MGLSKKKKKTYLHGVHSFNTKVTLLITNRNGGKSERPPFSF